MCSAWDLVYAGGTCWDGMDLHAEWVMICSAVSDIYTVTCSPRRVNGLQVLCVCKYVIRSALSVYVRL